MVRKTKRDYRAEYRRRVERAESRGYSRAIARGHPPEGVVGLKLAAKIRVPVGTEIEDITLRNVLPNHPWEKQGDDPKAIKQALKDEGFVERDLRGIEYTDQETFVKQLTTLYGYTFREAFDLYFGY